MSVKEKSERRFTRLELADYLEQLAAQLRKGVFETAGREWSVPDRLESEIAYKEKKGRLETKLKWRWSTYEEYESKERAELDRWQDSFKSIKKRLAVELKALQKAVASGDLPDEKILNDFVEDSNEMARFADPEWQDAMNDYLDHLENLKLAVDRRQLEVVEHELRDLRTQMAACHREHK